jgi:hypothetical protein
MICECIREQDVLDAIAANRWPRRCDDELRDHVAGCAICADLIEVVQPLLHEQEAASLDVRVPPPSVVWWRAQIRARNEAARAAAWPITIAQGAAVATILTVAMIVVLMGWARLDGWREALLSFARTPQSFAVPLPSMPAFVSQHALLLALAVGTCLIVAPLAVYLAVSDE